jgi:hypothetical protein
MSIFKFVSFNRQYMAASLVYLGMIFVMLSTLPEIILYAQNNSSQNTTCSHTMTRYIEGQPVTETVPGCADGYSCCETTGQCEQIE